MNKKYILGIFLFAIVIVAFLFFLYNYSNNNNSKLGEADYNSTRTSQNLLPENETDSENVNNTIAENTTDNENNKEKDKKETEIASFTTKIYTKDSGRQNNLTLACSSLNDTIVENGKTFSFSKTVGKATSDKGYKKADVFRNGDVVEALGGGLCQVSTTLYNAVLKIPELKVTERHPHSNKVPYIKSGKDAAVSFRFTRL